MPQMKVQRDGCLTVLTSHRSVTILYFITPESEMSVLTP